MILLKRINCSFDEQEKTEKIKNTVYSFFIIKQRKAKVK